MEGSDPRTDGELLVATATDPEAFGTFFRRHVRGVLAFFRRRVGRYGNLKHPASPFGTATFTVTR
jgi:hypothetical protein